MSTKCYKIDIENGNGIFMVYLHNYADLKKRLHVSFCFICLIIVEANIMFSSNGYNL